MDPVTADADEVRWRRAAKHVEHGRGGFAHGARADGIGPAVAIAMADKQRPRRDQRQQLVLFDGGGVAR
jgi:hypothetical protein